MSADQPLIARAKAGEIEAFEALLFRYQRQVLGTALRFLANRDDARDAAQEVFLKLYRHLRDLDPERPVAPWLYRVTINVCHDIVRRRRGAFSGADFTWAESMPQTGGPDADPGRRLILEEEWRTLQQALATLPEKERAAIILRDVEELETREVAQILGTSEVTVRSHISRARMKIKRHLERMLGRRL
jgi:RNA polymerase sigma-70 factor (ECF subfamily)